MDLCESVGVRPIELDDRTFCHAAVLFSEINETLLCQSGSITLFETRMLVPGEGLAVTIPTGIRAARIRNKMAVLALPSLASQ